MAEAKSPAKVTDPKFDCFNCDKQYQKKGHLVRHLGLAHGVDLLGVPLSPAGKARFAKSTDSGTPARQIKPLGKKPKTMSRAIVSSDSSDENEERSVQGLLTKQTTPGKGDRKTVKTAVASTGMPTAKPKNFDVEPSDEETPADDSTKPLSTNPENIINLSDSSSSDSDVEPVYLDPVSSVATVNLEADLALSSDSDQGGDDDLYVELTTSDREAAAIEEAMFGKKKKERSRSPPSQHPDPCQRKATHPLKIAAPICSRIRKQLTDIHERRSFPPPTPKTAQRRRTHLTRSALAKELFRHRRESLEDILERLAQQYSWTPHEREMHYHRLADIRTGQIEVAYQIRTLIPYKRNQGNLEKFIDVVGETIDEITKLEPSDD